MPTSRFQPSFAGGVVGPGLYGRIDTAKYDVALRIGRNVFVHVHGGVSNRAGTRLVGAIPDETKPARLMPFERDENENYVLLFGDRTMNVIERGAFHEENGARYEATTPYTAEQAVRMDNAQSIDVVYLTDRNVFPQKLQRFGRNDWRFSDLETNPDDVAVPTNLQGSAAGNGTAETYSYVVSATVDGVEGFVSAPVDVVSDELDRDGSKITLTWDGAADEFQVYRERNGVFGYIGFTEGNEFVDDNINPDLTSTPVERAEVFETVGEYPATVTLFQQRLIVAGASETPETMLASRIGEYENFTRSRILRADDRIELDVTGQGIARINAMLQLRELLLFTTSGEFAVSGPDDTLTATNPIQTRYGYSGSIGVQPLIVDDTALFVDGTGRQVRDLRYAFEQDGYAGNDLTIFASHYFEDDQIAGWAFARNPYSVVWCYLASGKLLSLTYKREHQVWAWTEHDVGGAVESVAVVREATYDALYLIVRREIGGVTRRFVERMDDRRFTKAEDAYFVDCGITYRGAPATTITGLDHLEGEAVIALADGNVVEGLTVTGGAVELGRAASVVHVGLPFTSEIETLPPAVDLQDAGAARGRPHKVSKLRIQMERTRGIEAGPESRETTVLVQTAVDLAKPIELETGMVTLTLRPEWNRDGTVRVVQKHPLPMTILGLSPELTIGRSE